LRITANPKQRPVADYISLQRRFAHWTRAEMDRLQREVDRNWKALKKAASE